MVVRKSDEFDELVDASVKVIFSTY